MGLGLVTDLYELTMVASYLRRGMTGRATFSVFARRLPPHRGFLVAAGLDDVLTLLEQLSFDEADLAWLATQGFDAEAVEGFRDLRFTGDVRAVPEGHVLLADEPLLEITAPLPEAQLVETLVLNQVTYQTALATKAARCQVAVGGRAGLVDFSLRRTHGMEAGRAAARAGAMAGFVGTSNAAAARELGIPAVGTMAHAYIQAFPSERDAFVAFAEDFPGRTTFLVDTYDTLAGVRIALEVAEVLDLRHGVGVRLDSGDLLALSKEARGVLDAAGRPDITIVASGGLDEHDLARLLDAGAPIDVFGVGTRIGVSADAPTVDTVYKLVEYEGRPVMKLSTGKQTRPGAKQVYRHDEGDVLALASEPAAGGTPLLVPVMDGGKRLAPTEPIAAAQARLVADLGALPEAALRLHDPVAPTVRVSGPLDQLTREVAAEHSRSGV